MSGPIARTFHSHLSPAPAPLTRGARTATGGQRRAGHRPSRTWAGRTIEFLYMREWLSPRPAGQVSSRDDPMASEPESSPGSARPLQQAPDGRSRKVTTATSAKSHEMHRWTGRIPYQSHNVTPTLTNPCGQRLIMMPIAFAFLACYCKLSDMPKRGGHK
jgi:hypothetical protein